MTMDKSYALQYRFFMTFWIFVIMILMTTVSAVDQQQQEQPVVEVPAVNNNNSSDDDDTNNDADPSSETCSTMPQNDDGTATKDCSEDQKEQETKQAIQDVIDYVRENDGYINEKLKIYRPPGSAVRGIYATEELEKDEILCQLPWKLLISPENKYLYFDNEDEGEDAEDEEEEYGEGEDVEDEEDEEESDEEYEADMLMKYCDSIDILYHDMKHNLTPYGRFLRYHQPNRYIPAVWTEGGKMVYRDILDPDEKPYHFDQYSLLCDLDDEDEENQMWLQDELWIHADMLMRARADDWILMPFYDMTNHRNGQYYNSHHVMDYGKSFTLTTNRRIMAGEQIYNSYNECNRCDARQYDYDTAQLFMDYGFVEDYPRFFLITSARLKFRIYEEEEEVRETPNENNNAQNDNASSKSKTATKAKKRVEFALPPSDLGVTYLEKEIKRLEEFKNDNTDLWMQTITETNSSNDHQHNSDDDGVGKSNIVNEIRYKGIVLKQFELDAVLSLFDAVISGYKLAFKAAKGKTSNVVWVECDAEKWWYTENYEKEGC